jgi:drug/metabolite transporter (DMT)-like permease
MKTLLALAAACFLGIGFVAQQHVAYREPLDEMLHMRLLARLIRQPVWLLGIAAMICGQVLGAVALDESDLGRVEPLLATNLIFALVIAHMVYKEPLSREVWGGGLLVTGGAVIFLTFGQPHGGSTTDPASARWLAAAAVVVIAILLVAGALPRSLRTKAMMFAAAAGILFGVQDALTRSSLMLLGQGIAAGLRSWQPYALVGIAVLALLLAQSAFDAAPIGISLPAMTAVEPIVGIVLGIFVFAERLRLSQGAVAAEVIGLLMIVTGIGVLGRSSFLGKPTPETGPGSGGGPG